MLWVCRGVWPWRGGEREGVGQSLSGSGPTKAGGVLNGGKAKWVAGRVVYGFWGEKEGGGGDMWVWMCRINLGMVGLRYVSVK
jgi:hypothetical protein